MRHRNVVRDLMNIQKLWQTWEIIVRKKYATISGLPKNCDSLARVLSRRMSINYGIY